MAMNPLWFNAAQILEMSFFFSYTPLKESVKKGRTECNHLYTSCKTSLKNILGNLCEQYRH